MTNKDKEKPTTAAELRDQGKALLEQAAQIGKDEIQELVHEIVDRFKKIKQAIIDHELVHSLEDFFDDMEEDDDEATDKNNEPRQKSKKEDLEAIRFLINDKNTDTAPFVAPTAPKRTGMSYTDDEKTTIIKGYQAARDAYKKDRKNNISGAAYLRDQHNIQNATLVNGWISNRDKDKKPNK